MPTVDSYINPEIELKDGTKVKLMSDDELNFNYPEPVVTVEVTYHGPESYTEDKLVNLIHIIKACASAGLEYDGDHRKTCRKIRNLNKQLAKVRNEK